MSESSVQSAVVTRPVKGAAKPGEPKATSGTQRLREERTLEGTTVRSIMTQPVLTVVESESLLDAAQIMRRGHVSGLPVLDRDGRLVGVISEKDIVGDLDRAAGLGKVRGILDLLLDLDGRPGPSRIEPSLQRLHKGRVKDAMTPSVVWIDGGATAAEAGRLLRQHTIKRLPVLEHGQMVGIVTRENLLQAFHGH